VTLGDAMAQWLDVPCSVTDRSRGAPKQLRAVPKKEKKKQLRACAGAHHSQQTFLGEEQSAEHWPLALPGAACPPSGEASKLPPAIGRPRRCHLGKKRPR